MKSITLSALLVFSLLACGQPGAQAALSQAELKTVALEVEGMTCKNCENHIKRTLAKLPGVSEVTASHQEKKVVVKFDPKKISVNDIKASITEMEYHVKGEL